MAISVFTIAIAAVPAVIWSPTLPADATLSAAVLASTPDSSATLQIGAVTDITWGTTRADIDRTVAAMKAAGVTWTRANLNWRAGEEMGRGILNAGYLSDIDYAVNSARAAGIQVLMPIADGVPYWASADPAKYTDAAGQHWNQYWHPTSNADYASFASRMVQRYAALGVHAYEVWNEPNISRFWPSGPDPVGYEAMLAAAYPAIKAADPSSTVVLGGLSESDYSYLAKLYAAGAGPYFDVAAIHPYTGEVGPTECWNQAGSDKAAEDAFCGIGEVHNTMVANGDGAKSIWLTEFGWSTTNGAYGVSEADQARFLTSSLNELRTTYPYVKKAFWYDLRNDPSLGQAPDSYDGNLGLLRLDFSPKPAYAALASWTAATGVPAPTTSTGSPPAPSPVRSSTRLAVSHRWLRFGQVLHVSISVYPDPVGGRVSLMSGTTLVRTLLVTNGHAVVNLRLTRIQFYRLRAFYHGATDIAPSASTVVGIHVTR